MRMVCAGLISLFALLTTCLLEGCAGRWSPAATLSVQPLALEQLRYARSYVLGKESTAAIGKPVLRVEMLTQGALVKEVVTHDTLLITAKYRFTPFTVTVPAKSKVPITDTMLFSSSQWHAYSGERHFIVPAYGSDGRKWGILVSADGYSRPYCMYSYTYHMLYCSYSMQKPSYDFEVLSEKVDTGTVGSYELVFSGKNETSLNFLYREYTGSDMARPAYYQNLTYQPDAKQIRFKDFVIQVKDATNEQITYSVVADDETRTDLR